MVAVLASKVLFNKANACSTLFADDISSFDAVLPAAFLMHTG